MELSKDQAAALGALNEGKSLFIDGPGGSGKSTLVRMWEKSRPDLNIVKLAATASAAQLIGGMTINSFLQLGTDPKLPGHSLPMRKDLYGKIRAADAFLIDEISMCRVDQFQAIRDRLFGAARGMGPFAGYQMVCIGDFLQLPPVLTDAEKPIIDKHYGSDGLFAFQNRFFSGLERAQLTTQHRQSADSEFRDFLNAMREGGAVDLDFINQRVGPIPEGGSTQLTATRARARALNAEAMAKLPAGSYTLRGEVDGHFPDSAKRLPSAFQIKPNSRVIICANDPDKAYHNGSTGVLQKCVRDEEGRPAAVVALDNGGTVTVKAHTWEHKAYDMTSKGYEAKVTGTYTQLPLAPGYATTIHYAQGMTLDRAHIDPSDMFAPGQLYVALGRVGALENLTLAAPVTEDHIMHDPRVMDFMGISLSAKKEPATEPA